MRIAPLAHSDNVLVELDPFATKGGEEDFYGSGIIRPEVAEERSLWGTVRAVGGGRETKRGIVLTTVRPGDRVLVPWNEGDEMTINEKLHIMIPESKLLAVVE